MISFCTLVESRKESPGEQSTRATNEDTSAAALSFLKSIANGCDYMMKNFERDSLKREHDKYLEEQNRLINEGMVKRTYQLLKDVRTLARKIAEEDGFDYVFEVSGKTSSQLSALIYIREATDLTARIIGELNRNAPRKDVAANEGP